MPWESCCSLDRSDNCEYAQAGVSVSRSDVSDRSVPLEDYALIGDCERAALVSKAGSIDWLCLPRFDAPACFAKLLGTRANGYWLVAPNCEVRSVRRLYVPGTMVLETTFETDDGSLSLTDFMLFDADAGSAGSNPQLTRVVTCTRGLVPVHMLIALRFDYGRSVPWVTRQPDCIRAVAGPDTVRLYASVPVHGENLHTAARFDLSAGQSASFSITHCSSHLDPSQPVPPETALSITQKSWRSWAERSAYRGDYREVVERSLLTLKALTFRPTGGIVAAPTTSLPEAIGGVRNWDYRVCWLRDAAITLYALLVCGYTQEAAAWRNWLLRAVAGSPDQAQVLYGIAGERNTLEYELPWLPGYEGSRPVRVGNAASAQLQLDSFGELMDAMYQCRRSGVENLEGWALERALLGQLEQIWRKPDHGIWEIRGEPRHFTHSKVMAWVAFDRAIRSIEQFGREGPVERWREVRDQIREDICQHGYSRELGRFTQSYDSTALDASLLLIPLVGFLPAEDPRVERTVGAIERELMIQDTFVQRYETRPELDGLPPSEGAFLACSFWLVSIRVMQGRADEARALFERLLELQNDVGLLAEEYDVARRRQVGNFPQAFSHLALVDAAISLSQITANPAEHRASNQNIGFERTQIPEANGGGS